MYLLQAQVLETQYEEGEIDENDFHEMKKQLIEGFETQRNSKNGMNSKQKKIYFLQNCVLFVDEIEQGTANYTQKMSAGTIFSIFCNF